ncbi:hypothetical protein Ddye_025129 [Dipteronia dyeriana]|uniref:Chaoptin n=1 Tax=Dipteronia dyeriana TaxID=168575 RepID=A0AAD9WU85_9ROSI|nr:hypothetical protein Ddye_025129 [Dipteronia dyeriana]
MDLDWCSNLTKFPKISRNVKKLYLRGTAVEEIPSLRHLTSLEALFLDGCSNITKFPQISGAITELHLSGTVIDEVPNSAIKSLNKLVELDLRYNTRLKNLPTSMIHLTSLERLHLDGCSNITKFPQIPGTITHLSLKETAIEEVPDSAIKFLNITKFLIKLDLSVNTRLKNLPTSLIHLTSLETLNLSGCSNITKFPQISGAITLLFMGGTAIDDVPNSAIESLYKLDYLDISGNTRLKNLPSMSHLTSLRSLCLSGCSNITEFPKISVEITNLYLSGTAIEEIPSFVERFTNLEYLAFDHCRSLKRVSSGIFKLK